jgi:hypothetical protein
VNTATPPFVAVTSITGVPNSATAGTPLTLTGTVNPGNATNQTIVWSVKTVGTTGATVSGSTLNTTSAGTVVVTATIVNGATATSNYTQDFTITVNTATPPFVAVTSITGVPNSATAGTPLTLTGTVNPNNATNQTIVWSVKTAGTTGATVSGSTLNTTSAGTVVVTATIVNGATATSNYTQDFTITVNVPSTTTFTITASAGAGGSISPSGAVTVSQGGSQLFTASPNAGKLVDEWRLNGSTVQTGGATYLASNVQASATLQVTFKDDLTANEEVNAPSMDIWSANGVLTIKSGFPMEMVRIYNLSGQLLYGGDVGGQYQLEISGLPRGVLIVKVIMGDQDVTKKVVN